MQPERLDSHRQLTIACPSGFCSLLCVCCVQLVELKSGETYNGHLDSCDTWMNINLKDVICTSRVSTDDSDAQRSAASVCCGR